MLENLGYSYDIVSDGTAALSEYALVLLDIHMPKMGGLEGKVPFGFFFLFFVFIYCFFPFYYRFLFLSLLPLYFISFLIFLFSWLVSPLFLEMISVHSDTTSRQAAVTQAANHNRPERRGA